MENSVRRMLLLPHNAHRKIDALWRSRIRCVSLGVEHLPLLANTKIFLHLIPVSEEPFMLDRNDQKVSETTRTLPLLLDRFPHYHRVTIDGLFGYTTSDQTKSTIESYRQLFWDGSVEYCDAVWGKRSQLHDSNSRLIYLPYFEDKTVQCLTATLSVLKRLDVPLPVRTYLALVGFQGFHAVISRDLFPTDLVIDRNELLFDPVMIDAWDDDSSQTMRPIFDQLWNACGYMRSLSYDESGAWKPNLR